MMQEIWETWLKDRNVMEKDFRRYMAEGSVIKISPSERLSRIHLEKAFHNIDFANFTIQNQDKINKRLGEESYFDWVITISYYAMYHAALAALFRLGYKSSSHMATICVLCKECLGKTLSGEDIKKFSRVLELGENEIKELGTAKQRRERASYSGSISFERNLAELTLEDAIKFVNKLADILEIKR